MRPSSTEEAFLAVEGELRQERASALGRAGRRLEEQFERCQLLARQLDAEPGSGDLLGEYRVAREAFEEYRWRLCVQREALGLSDHRWVERVYPTPVRR